MEVVLYVIYIKDLISHISQGDRINVIYLKKVVLYVIYVKEILSNSNSEICHLYQGINKLNLTGK